MLYSAFNLVHTLIDCVYLFVDIEIRDFFSLYKSLVYKYACMVESLLLFY